MLAEQFAQFGDLAPKIGIKRKNELELLERHFVLLKEWNERIGLVSRKSIDKSAISHYLDSINIVDFSERWRGSDQVLELGSGAGFPGAIYAIRYPGAQVRLYEKMLKKQSFLTAMSTQLALENVSVAGDFPSKISRSLIVARAVLPPTDLFEFMAKRMETGCKLMVNLGGKSEPVKTPKEFSLLSQIKYELPGDSGNRIAMCFEYVPRETKKGEIVPCGTF